MSVTMYNHAVCLTVSVTHRACVPKYAIISNVRVWKAHPWGGGGEGAVCVVLCSYLHSTPNLNQILANSLYMPHLGIVFVHIVMLCIAFLQSVAPNSKSFVTNNTEQSVVYSYPGGMV